MIKMQFSPVEGPFVGVYLEVKTNDAIYYKRLRVYGLEPAWCVQRAIENELADVLNAYVIEGGLQ